MGQVMVLIELDSAIIVALISLAGTIFVGFTNRQKFTRAEAIGLEARLTSIEKTQEAFNNEMRVKLDPIWNVMMNELPKMLISPDAPRLDILLKKAVKNRKDMSDDEFEEMKMKLKEEYNHAIETHDRSKGVLLAFYMATFGVK